jgi:hypothetical protein
VWASLAGVAVVWIAGTAAVMKEMTSPHPNGYLLALYTFGLVGGMTVGSFNVSRARFKDMREDKKDSADDLRACLHVVLQMVCGYRGVVIPADGWMRLTVHRVHKGELEQAVDYVGSADGGAGRRLPRTAGLIGAVLADPAKRPLVFERPRNWDRAEWVDYLVRVMRMPRARAESARPDRFSFMAVAIRDPHGAVAAVVYADASAPGFFDATTQAIVVRGCVGLAHWVNERYFA